MHIQRGNQQVIVYIYIHDSLSKLQKINKYSMPSSTVVIDSCSLDDISTMEAFRLGENDGQDPGLHVMGE